MTSSEPVIRAATAADIVAFYGKPLGASVRALVAEIDGRPLAIGGIRMDNGHPVLFSDVAPEMKRYRKAILRGAREILRMATRPAYAVADPQHPGAARLLSRLGMTPVSGADGQEVYRWDP